VIPFGPGWQRWREINREHARRSPQRHQVGTQNGQRVQRVGQAQDVADLEARSDQLGEARVADRATRVRPGLEADRLPLPRSVGPRERRLEQERPESQVLNQRLLGLRDERGEPEPRAHASTAPQPRARGSE
jgi:hypothetical protein